MENTDLQTQFKKVETDISKGLENNQDVTPLLKEKIRLLYVGYENLSRTMENPEIKVIAPLFAKRLAFLNNIKAIQEQVNEDTSSTIQEIEKVHTSMREKGLGWLLDNMPEKKA